MSEPRDDVLNKLDALMKKHASNEPEIPVLTDLVEQPRIDLDAIPLLTDEISLDVSPEMAETAQAKPEPSPSPMPSVEFVAPETPIELDLVHESFLHNSAPAIMPPSAPATPSPEPESVLARLEAVEAEVQAEIDARIAQVQAVPNTPPMIEIPQEVQYIALASTPEPALPPIVESEPALAAVAAPTQLPPRLPEETVQQLAALIEADVARMIKSNLHQTLSAELPMMLNSALDKALSSMLEQFMMHMEEVVRSAIADELKKQLAPFKRPASGTKP